MIPTVRIGYEGKSALLAASYVRYLQSLALAFRALGGLLLAVLGLPVRILAKGPVVLCAGFRRGWRRGAKRPSPFGRAAWAQHRALLPPFWDSLTVDSLEQTFWETHDRDGRPLPPLE